MDKAAINNTNNDTFNRCFDLLEKTINDNNLRNKPHQILNCHESAVLLNKSAKTVLVPRTQKRAHTIATTSGQHITILCTTSASGLALPIVISKGFPSGRFHREGPPGAAYASSRSGFMDRDIYLDWFQNIFLKFAPAQRPLLPIQDSTTAHTGPALIDTVIRNDVILLCFPPNYVCDICL